MNFLKETLVDIEGSGHTTDDVMFVGSMDGNYRVTFDEFTKIANIEYDNGYGAQEIAHDLIVYFTDCSYLVRHEYDGSEQWNYVPNHRFSMEDDYKSFTKVCVNQVDLVGWESLETINEENK